MRAQRGRDRWPRGGRGRPADSIAELLDGQRGPANAAEARILDAAALLRDWPAPRLRPAARAAVMARLFETVDAPPTAQTTDPANGNATPTPISAPTSTSTEGTTDTAPARPADPRPASAGAVPEPTPEPEPEPTPVAGPADAARRSSGARPVRRGSVSRRRRAVQVARPVLAGTLAAAITASGLAISAANAMPGELLYGVKRQVENLQVALARDPVVRARTRLDVANTRMNELRAMVTKVNRHPIPPDGLGLSDPLLTRIPGTSAGGSASPGTVAPPTTTGTGTDATVGGPGSTTGTGPDGAEGLTPTPTRPPAWIPPAGGGSGTPVTRHEVDAAMVNTLLHDWCTETQAGAKVLLAEVADGNTAAWKTMSTFAAEQSRGLSALVAALPPGSRQSARQAEDLIARIETDLGPTAPTTAATGTPMAATTPSPTPAADSGAAVIPFMTPLFLTSPHASPTTGSEPGNPAPASPTAIPTAPAPTTGSATAPAGPASTPDPPRAPSTAPAPASPSPPPSPPVPVPVPSTATASTQPPTAPTTGTTSTATTKSTTTTTASTTGTSMADTSMADTGVADTGVDPAPASPEAAAETTAATTSANAEPDEAPPATAATSTGSATSAE